MVPPPDESSSPSEETPAAEDVPSETDRRPPMPIVGIGASAGGIGALRTFFGQIPKETDMAFVVVMHLASDYESNLTEILQKETDLPMEKAQDGTEVLGGHVYVIPPGRRLEIEAGTLHLEETTKTHETSTIDRFFRTLASDQADNAVGIVLSGTGTDGALGLRAIKEAGGVTFVQAPEDAEYDHMPKTAIATGLVDLVAPAAELAERLVQYRSSAGVITLPAEEEEEEEALDKDERSVLQKILTRLYTEAGHDFSGYKRSSMFRRLERRMQIRSAATLEAYLRILRENGEEIQALKRDLLITVTSFFRDPEAWKALEEQVIPRLFEDKGPTDQVRVWVAGCATGEEAYSLAMLLLEQADTLDAPPSLQVFATDVSEEALEIGREGLYPQPIEADVSAERLDQFFRAEDAYYRVVPRLRETVLFAEHDILTDPPFSNLDLVSCRNLLIYLQPEMQSHVLQRLHYGLREQGYLFLGRSEAISRASDLFSTVDKANNLLQSRPLTDEHRPKVPISGFQTRREESDTLFSDQGEPRTSPSGSDSPPDSTEEIHRRALMEEVASVLVDEKYQIVHLSDQANQFLNFEGGTPNLEVLSFVPDGIRPVLRTSLYHAFKKEQPSEHTRIEATINGETRLLNLSVRPIEEAGGRTYAHVRLEESEDPSTEPSRDPSSREAELEGELERTREQLQTTTEEYEAANEEMEAANEELLSMNEELQSKNEELETSKEELQSLNEELKTTNQELKNKIDELREANSDLENLMEATDVATLFLNRDLKIKRFTPRVKELFSIQPADIGRALSDFTQRFEYEGLLDDARQVLRTAESMEREIRQGEETWVLVRLRPYRTVGGEIEGVVLSFVDITSRRQLEREVVNASEEVRRRIGWDLHDTLSSDLTAVTMVVGTLKDSLAEKDVEEAEELEEVQKQLEDSVETARTLAQELAPVSLKDEPLARALEQLCREQDDFSDLQFRFEGDLDESLPADQETALHLYRIAHEAILNARRHAGASEVRVSLRREDGVLRLSVQDDGSAAEEDLTDRQEDPLADTDGIGHHIMKHRANLIGGSLRIDAGDEGGTVVQCDLPIDQATQDGRAD